MFAICRLRARLHNIEVGGQSRPLAYVGRWPNSDVAARKSFNSVPQRRSEAAEALLPGETVSADLDRRLVAVSEAQHEIIADPRNLDHALFDDESVPAVEFAVDSHANGQPLTNLHSSVWRCHHQRDIIVLDDERNGAAVIGISRNAETGFICFIGYDTVPAVMGLELLDRVSGKNVTEKQANVRPKIPTEKNFPISLSIRVSRCSGCLPGAVSRDGHIIGFKSRKVQLDDLKKIATVTAAALSCAGAQPCSVG